MTVSASAGGEGVVRGIARVADRPQADVVVWLDPPTRDAAVPGPMPVLDQRDLQFLPHVLVVQAGTTVKFPNSDRIFHNVFSFRDGERFDLGVYPVGAVKYVKFDRPGVSRLFCNIHPRMAGYVVTVGSSYFATTSAAGTFSIQAPPGRYTYHAWRSGGPVLDGSITVDGASSLDITWP